MATNRRPPDRNADHCYRCKQPYVPTHTETKIWLCIDCNRLFCESCWLQIEAHQAGGVRWRHREHERIDPWIQDRLDEIFRPKYTLEQLNDLHKADEATTWFGVGKERDGNAFLTDGGVYQALMLRSQADYLRRYPQIVSLIGDANAGKSTLIKMLIEFAEHRHKPGQGFNFPSPVVGPRETSDPTSVDVHMYADPDTFGQVAPLLFADCEGLSGGEQVPRGGRAGREGQRREPLAGGTMRTLWWADTPERSRRKTIVSVLYPRLLYTFSDVVVFVTPNRRTFEERGLEPLLKWAHASLERSINQAVLPHLIVVNNNVDYEDSSTLWQVGPATDQALNNVQDSFRAIPKVKSYAAFWKRRGKTINSTLDLIHCYYSSFKVVSIPHADQRTALMLRQLSCLREQIKDCCESSHVSRSQARMLCTSSELGMFIQAAFDHFSQTLARPFNFIEASLRIHPIPRHIGGNMLQLAIEMQAKSSKPIRIFEQMSKLIASCILLDCVRTGRKGNPSDHLRHYQAIFNDMLRKFSDIYATCEYTKQQNRCVNTKTSHTKGHQNHKGKIFADGQYRSKFTYESFQDKWAKLLHSHIAEASEEFNLARDDAQGHRSSSSSETSISHPFAEEEEDTMMECHSDVLDRFYIDNQQISTFRSHGTCVCCFVHVPEHILPCGHALCSTCVKAWALEKGESHVVLYNCPLHFERLTWSDPFLVRFKPHLAGVRILTLDGGGIRGIVEIEILKAMQARLGKIPIQAFFDLVIGTSTGGLVAIALGAKGWDLQKVEKKFRELSRAAFTPREFHGIFFLEQIATFYHSSVYKTRPLYNTLRRAFGDSSFFGSQQDPPLEYDIKVGVTSTNEECSRPLLLANYNRANQHGDELVPQDEEVEAYGFLRPDRPAYELASWQVGAATAAAIPYFKPFYHDKSLRNFLDGGFYNNNPSKVAKRESELLWPDVAEQSPDVFLSIGTGQDKNKIEAELEKVRKREAKRAKRASRGNFIPFPDAQQYFANLKSRLNDIFDAEKAWHDFLSPIHTSQRKRYVRLNPDVGGEPPKLDEVLKLHDLSSIIKDRINGGLLRFEIQRTARMLIASTFYFRLISRVASAQRPEHSFDLNGCIACRFEETSNNLKDLGKLLKTHTHRRFRPYFVVWTENDQIPQQRKVTSDITRLMIDDAAWELDPIILKSITETTMIHISFILEENEEPCAISGFPRKITWADHVQTAGNSAQRAAGTNSTLHRRPHRWNPAELANTYESQTLREPAYRSVTHPEPLYQGGRNELSGSRSWSKTASSASSILSELPGDFPSLELPTRMNTATNSTLGPPRQTSRPPANVRSVSDSLAVERSRSTVRDRQQDRRPPSSGMPAANAYEEGRRPPWRAPSPLGPRYDGQSDSRPTNLGPSHRHRKQNSDPSGSSGSTFTSNVQATAPIVRARAETRSTHIPAPPPGPLSVPRHPRPMNGVPILPNPFHAHRYPSIDSLVTNTPSPPPPRLVENASPAISSPAMSAMSDDISERGIPGLLEVRSMSNLRPREF